MTQHFIFQHFIFGTGLYGQEQDMFDRDFLTENEFRSLFQHDDQALNRMGVRSVEEVRFCSPP